MIKGIAGFGYRDELVVPIIENTPFEYELTASLEAAVLKYPRAVGVLVRHHGVYVWGNSWEDAKRHAECMHYLFDLSVKMCHLSSRNSLASDGLQLAVTSDSPPRSATKKRRRAREDSAATASFPYRAVVMDIEGTTTPITFVKDVMFPYAASRVEGYLKESWGSDVTQGDLAALRRQYEDDLKSQAQVGLSLNYPSDTLPQWTSGPISREVDESLLGEVVRYVRWNISQDRKVKALKDLQGRVWREGFVTGAIVGQVYEDVPPFLEKMNELGVTLCIYSSGSRDAQKLLFGYCNHGDLRPYFSCYFDTAVGNKRSATSYKEIALTLNVDGPSEILFLTDIYEEAQAAKDAGMAAIISVRPGNAKLPDDVDKSFKLITSFDQILN